MPPIPYTPPCGLDIAATTITEPGGLARIASWGHRLVVHADGMCFIHEAYYDAADALLGVALAPARPCGGAPEELRAELDLMAEAFDEPPLRYADLVAEPARYGRYEGFPDVTGHPGWRSAGDGRPGEAPEAPGDGPADG